MFRAMVWKELRETRAIVVLALATYALLVAASAEPRFPNPITMFLSSSKMSRSIPFVQDDFVSRFCIASAAVAIALGLWQTLAESRRGTYLLLFHRPAMRRWLIGVKLLVGMAVYLVCGSIPILVYGLWAATPGHHASPFTWSMTVPCWVGWFGIATIYLGAFLAGIRPGRWSRSRVLPLMAAALVTLMIGLGDWTPWLQLSLFAMVDLCLIVLIRYVIANRDYS